MSSEPVIPRIVKTRKTGYTHLPILVVSSDGYAVNEHAEVFYPDEFLSVFPRMPSHIIAVMDAGRFLANLDETYSADARWQYRITPLKQHVMRANGKLSTWTMEQVLVNFLGWKRPDGKSPSRYHYPLDPSSFTRGIPSDLLPEGFDEAQRLGRWARDIREWCREHDLRITPTAGGLAAQLLKDPQFFPPERRKVPRATNARVRPKLPGNFYHLYADTDTPYQAFYLDMKSAHHTIAATLEFPDPDTLDARGFFDVADVTDVSVSTGRPWLKAGTRAFNRVLTESHGLLYVRLTVPPLRDHLFPPPYMRHPGGRMVWIYTNEVPMVRALGGRIEWITAAWISFKADPSLNRYARFAMEQVAQAQEARKRWLKPTLLAAYGILAARAQPRETAYKRSEKGQERQYVVGGRPLTAQAMISEREQESPLVNVMYRGMIEAEQRVRALDMARTLHRHGLRVLAIYADSVFVESNRHHPLPLLPGRWRLEAELDGLVFSSATHFTSLQLTKLPGIRRDLSERVQIIAGMRGELPGVGFAPFPKP